MSLCSQCQAIPFGSLPSPHADDTVSLTYGERELPTIHCECEELGHRLGYPWHSDLDSLAAAANSCGLCATIQRGFQTWLELCERRQKSLSSVWHQESYSHVVPVGERLWLAKRYGGSPGFIVLVRHPRNQRLIWVLTGVSFAVGADNPVANLIQVRPLNRDSGSLYNLDIVMSWVHKCCTQHTNCTVEETLLPSRVLDVSPSNGTIKLVELEGQKGIYVCLSYCWGGVGNFSTSRSTLETRHSGFLITDLPKTLQDAVVIVQHLGIRYLWIDSLCICQDDDKDWAMESARMTDIYSNAHIVIAANHAAHSQEGCFHLRPLQASCVLDVPGIAKDVSVQSLYTSDELGWLRGAFSSEPLSNRAWGLQERLLAKRVVHYNSRQLYYECSDGLFGEDGCNYGNRYTGLTSFSLQKNTAQQSQHDSHHHWHSLVHEYSSRKLTKQTDKLPALSGLAKIFAIRIQAEYLAGIWSDAIIEGLAWQGLGPQEAAPRDTYIAPSWSWASYGGIVSMETGASRVIAKALAWHIESKTQANPFGEVTGGWLRIHTPLVPLIRTRQKYMDPWHKNVQITTPYFTSSKYRSYFTIDHADILNSSCLEEWTIHAMILGRFEYSYDRTPEETRIIFCLVVIDVGQSSSNRMKRVGWTHLDSEEVQRIVGDQTTWRTVELE